MFGSKQFDKIVERLDSIDKKIDDINTISNQNHNEIKVLKTNFSNEFGFLKDQVLKISYELTKELKIINEESSRLKKCVNSFDSIKNRVDSMLMDKLNKLVDVEIKAVKEKFLEIDSVEKNYKSLIDELSKLESNIQKFNNISSNIKEVDFTLNKHMNDISQVEKKKILLEQENDRLKSIMAKMKRNRHN